MRSAKEKPKRGRKGRADGVDTRLQVMGGPVTKDPLASSAPGDAGMPGVSEKFHGKRDKRARICIYFAIALVAVYLVGFVLPNNVLSANNTRLSLAWWVGVLQGNITAYAQFFLEQKDVATVGMAIAQRTMPIIAGAALGISGAIYQGSLKNALASPSTLGVMAGATLGVTAYSLLRVSNDSYVEAYTMSQAVAQYADLNPLEYLMATQELALWAVIGALATASIVLGIALIAGRGRISGIALIITGQVLMTLLGAVNQLVRYWMANTAPDSMQSLTMRSLQVSKLGGAFNWVDVLALGAPTLACIIALLLLAPKLNLLAFGEDEARSMGVHTNRLRIVAVGLCTLLTAIVVAYCGVIGFIGFFIPHLMRRLVGPDMRFLMPASALGGSLFLMVAYDVVSFYDSTALSSIGIVTSLIGGAVFLVIVIRQRGASDGWM